MIVVAVDRLLGAEPIRRRRLLYGSIAYSVGFAATYTGLGVGIHSLVGLFS